MTSRKAEANRANARKSTGPRTTAGKRTSSRNALSHGLNTPIKDSQTLVDLTVRFAQSRTDDPNIMMVARRAAISYAQYRRVRMHFDAVYECLDAPLRITPAPVDIPDDYASLGAGFAALLMDIIPPVPAPQRLTIPEFAKALDRLARYERRAFSARSKAISQLERALSESRVLRG